MEQRSRSNAVRGGRAQFFLERWVQRGVLPQLFLMVVLVALVAVLGGVAAWALTPAFEDLGSAVWWSFLRLTDPGYLGDDEGTALRVVSTVVTVLGYVLFMGSLIAILTQWLAGTIRRLESGVTPIVMHDHFVILGWTNRTPEIIQKLLTARGRLARFLEARGASRRLRIVVLADTVDAARRQNLRELLGADWKEGQVFLRSGSSLVEEHLERLDLARAAMVMVPGADFELGGAELTDMRVMKTLLTLDGLFRRGGGETLPRVVAELFDPRKVAIAKTAVSAPTEVVAGDRMVSRLLSQSLRQSGISKVLLSLLTHREGNAIYVRNFPELAGADVRELVRAFPRAVVLGVARTEARETLVDLDPTHGVRLEADDRLVLLAEQFDDCELVPDEVEADPPPVSDEVALDPEARPRRLLVLGWSFKLPTLLEELAEASSAGVEVTLVSRMKVEDRDRPLAAAADHPRLVLENVEADYAIEHDLVALHPERFDHVVFLASGWMSSSEEADARTVLGVLLLRSVLARLQERRPEVLVELLDPDNARILDASADTVLVSPRVLSHLLAHVGLRPELNAVFDELICAGGSQVELHPAEALGLESSGLTFEAAQAAARVRGAVAMGFVLQPAGPSTREVLLNPPRDRRVDLGPEDRLVLLCRAKAG